MKPLTESYDLFDFQYLGALFTTETEEQELSFNYAIDQINGDLTLLATTTLIPNVENVDTSDSFLIQQKGFDELSQ